jgi:hypothetical protein
MSAAITIILVQFEYHSMWGRVYTQLFLIKNRINKNDRRIMGWGKGSVIFTILVRLYSRCILHYCTFQCWVLKNINTYKSPSHFTWWNLSFARFEVLLVVNVNITILWDVQIF